MATSDDLQKLLAKDLPDSVKGKILHLFFDWLLQVYKTSSVAEVRERFILLTPLEECRLDGKRYVKLRAVNA